MNDVMMKKIVDVNIEVKDEHLSQKQAVACGKVTSLENEVMTVLMLCSLLLAQPSASSAHINRSFRD